MTTTYVHDPRKAVAAAMTLLGQQNADLADELTKKTGKTWTKNMVASLVGRRRKLETQELIEIQKVQGFPMAFYLYGPFAIGDQSDSVKGLKVNREKSLFNRPVPLAETVAA